MTQRHYSIRIVLKTPSEVGQIAHIPLFREPSMARAEPRTPPDSCRYGAATYEVPALQRVAARERYGLVGRTRSALAEVVDSPR